MNSCTKTKAACFGFSHVLSPSLLAGESQDFQFAADFFPLMFLFKAHFCK